MSDLIAPAERSVARDGAAWFSVDGKYRYLLTREFGGSSTCLFVMLNPSTADEVVDDPTIRRCIGFAWREGFGRLEIVNLYGFRATEPGVLFEAEDPVGSENDLTVEEALKRADLVIAAWGNHGGHVPGRMGRVVDMLRISGQKSMCFGFTKQNQPRHPLYLASGVELVEFPV